MPVNNKFLKLSTSKAALLLFTPVLSAPVRSSVLDCSGSSDARVRANGFAGTLPDERGTRVESLYGLDTVAMSDAPTLLRLAASYVAAP